MNQELLTVTGVLRKRRARLLARGVTREKSSLGLRAW